jgi:nicotinate-nucleotide pyrophosphorylase (carboxylating)
MHDPAASLRECVRRALAEDLGSDLDAAADVTSRLSVPATLRGRVRILAKANGVLAGIACAAEAFRALDATSRVSAIATDGHAFEAGSVVIEAEGVMRALLAAERTALNFLQRLSGVATLTRAFVDAVAGTRARILDTRKTTPGLRALEKAAVVAGGGVNHRLGLFDQVLLKENHFRSALPTSYEDVVRRCVREQARPVVAEARDLVEAAAAVRGGAAIVLLDNFAPGQALAAAVREVRTAAAAAGRSVLTEASGGVTLASVRAFADSGVDRISIGALTHSAPAVDLSLLVEGVS